MVRMLDLRLEGVKSAAGGYLTNHRVAALVKKG
jgi:hypothetical protein